jgi:hypothetical protein
LSAARGDSLSLIAGTPNGRAWVQDEQAGRSLLRLSDLQISTSQSEGV